MSGNYILLTGAGFTCNFGAPTASNFRNYLLSEVKVDPLLSKVCIEHVNFEVSYVTVMNGGFTNDQKKLMHDSTVKCFKEKLNGSYENNTFGQAPHMILEHLLKPLCFKSGGLGYFFTLNQDLFVEKNLLIQHHILNSRIPGIQSKSSNPGIPEAEVIGIIDNSSVERAKADIKELLNHNGNKLLYIKSHGSSNWFRKSNSKEVLVIGADKDVSIKNEPLLSYYFDLLSEQLCKANSKILIIGYGFGDNHINELLKKAQDEHGLEVHIMNHDSKVEKALEKGINCKGLYNFQKAFLSEDYKGEIPYECKRFKEEFFS